MFCGGMELRLHLKLFNDDTTFRDVCGTCRFFGDARGCQCSFLLCLHPQGCLRRGVRASGSPQVRTGKSGSFSMLHHPRGYDSNFLVRSAHPEARRKIREPFPDKAGESTLLSGSGGRKNNGVFFYKLNTVERAI